jgi:hypothetical protein
MSDTVQRITIQLRPPKGLDAGKVAIGHYCVNADNYVVLCDEAGKPIGDERHHLDRQPRRSCQAKGKRRLRMRRPVTFSIEFCGVPETRCKTAEAAASVMRSGLLLV